MAGETASRRWPSLVAAVCAAVLALLVLPNPFRIPQTNPTATAEYAPVPGTSDDAQGANFGEVDLATSAGIGSEGQGEGALPGQPPPPIQQFKPRQKDCVGNPPRQTQDPLSPPCVPFFDGNNGGATFTGVTGDEIKVVLYNDRCCDGDMNAPWKPSDEDQCNSIYPEECAYTVRTVKAHIRYFNRRFQTYGRTVQVIAQKSTGNLGGSCASRETDAKNAVAQHEPFAAVSFAQGGQNCYFREMAENEVPVFGYNEDGEGSIYEELRPHVFGFMPSQEVQTAWSAGFICRKLAFEGAKARFAGDPILRTQDRKFGFIRPRGDSRGTELRLQAALLVQELRRQCNFEFDEEMYFEASATGAGGEEAADIMARFKREGITTVVCYCIPRQTELTAPTMQKAATSAGFFPEWYWDAASQMERAIFQRRYGQPGQPSLGATYWWRAPAFREQFHYQAYLEEEPGTAPAPYWNVKLYYILLNLFSAIQAAGPDLNPSTIERGMFTFNYTDRENPWVPIGGYGDYTDDAVGDYTFVDTAMAVWWDPSGTPPGGIRGEGCMRIARDGLRFYAEDWPRGDRDLFVDGASCTADQYKDADPA